MQSRIMVVRRVFVRGCPGQGTTWFETAIRCLFVHATITGTGKHHGCHIRSHLDPLVSHKLAHPGCTPDDCVHAVISRHPTQLKRGGQTHVWEAYYGAWARSAHNITNARFFRYEDAISRGCTAERADPSIVAKYRQRRIPCVRMHDPLAWKFWNYTSCPRDGTTLVATETIDYSV